MDIHIYTYITITNKNICYYIQDPTLNNRAASMNFQINGRVFHKIGPIITETERDPDIPYGFQSYIYDTNPITEIDPNLFSELKDELQTVNPYVQQFQCAYVQQRDNSDVNYTLHILDRSVDDSRTYNTPSASEVAIVMPGDGEELVCSYQNQYFPTDSCTLLCPEFLHPKQSSC